MIDRTTSESFGPESIKVRKFGLLSYEEVLTFAILIEEKLYKPACTNMERELLKELHTELELRG